MKRIAVLGSTGSIGTQTLEVVRANSEELCVTALAAGTSVAKMEDRGSSEGIKAKGGRFGGYGAFWHGGTFGDCR